MAINKYINKLNHIEAIVFVTNDAASATSATISLNTDLLKSNETISGTPTVNISAIESAIADNAEVIITRGGTTIFTLFENTNSFINAYGANAQNNTNDIVINFTGKGTISLRLLKINGYQANYRPEQGVGV